MKRLVFAVILSIISVFISGYANAMVPHLNNADIVGDVDLSYVVCFNNDGAVASYTECDGSGVDEGLLGVQDGNWRSGPTSGINSCGTDPVDPVSSATCSYSQGVAITACIGDEFILVQTTVSGHFWAVKGDSGCTNIAAPETTGLVPCLSSSAFNPATGCSPNPSPSEITIEEGYITLGTHSGAPPPNEHCTETAHGGRMVVDNVNSRIYICTQKGWEFISTSGVVAVTENTELACSDLIDNDGDSFIDCVDFDCDSAIACGGAGFGPENSELACTDGGDNDGNSFADCDDFGCDSAIACGGAGFGPEDSELACTDGGDNDGNSFADCDDFGCDSATACGGAGFGPESSELACTDGGDNDGDTYIDCADADCVDATACGGAGF